MESFAFPDIINLISTEIKQKCSKLQFFSLESLRMHLRLGNFFKGEYVLLLQLSRVIKVPKGV